MTLWVIFDRFAMAAQCSLYPDSERVAALLKISLRQACTAE
jgi:hypothetical protein